MVGPKAVQPPAASQTCPAHGIPGRKEQAGMEDYTTELAKALDPIPKFPTIAFCVFWDAVFVCLFWGEHSPEEDTPQGLCVPFPCPTLSCQKDCSPPGSHSHDSSFWCGWCFSEVPIPTAPTSPTYPMVGALTAAVHPARRRGRGSSAGQSAHPWHCSLSSGETLRSWGQEAVRQ